MQELRLVGVHEDGDHLLLSDDDGARYRVAVDESLRAAVRRDRPRLGQLQIEIDGGMRPRDVQAMIRAGLSAEEVAERSGWAVEKVTRYEGPILAERMHVAGLAREVRLRARGGLGRDDSLSSRVNHRLASREINPDRARWDANRGDEGNWTVVLTFPAGGRQRDARWHFDVPARTVVPANDEARWLSEEEDPAAPIPAPHMVAGAGHPATVYDLEAQGGLDLPEPHPHHHDPDSEMTASLREHSAVRGRRGARRRPDAPMLTAVDGSSPEDALPLDPVAFDPAAPPPPAARGHHPRDARDARVAREHRPETDTDLPAAEREAVAGGTRPRPRIQPAGTAAARQAREAASSGAASREGTTAEDPGEKPAAEKMAQEKLAQEKAAREKASREKATRRNGRPSVPSWDDIVFGAPRRD